MTELRVVVGSGPNAVAVTHALLQRGFPVTILDVGETLDPATAGVVQTMSQQEPGEWSEEHKSLIRRVDFSGSLAVSPKRAFGSAYAYFLDPAIDAPPDMRLYGSRAFGGLSNVWGCALLTAAPKDLSSWPPQVAAEITAAYPKIRDLVQEITGEDILGAGTHLKISNAAKRVLDKFQRRARDGTIEIYPTPLAISNDCKACNGCMYGCVYRYTYSSRDTIEQVFQHNRQFQYLNGMVVERFRETGDVVEIYAKNISSNCTEPIVAKQLFLAAGMMGSLKILWNSSPDVARTLQARDASLFIVPGFLPSWHAMRRDQHHGLSHLSVDLYAAPFQEKPAHFQLYFDNPVLSDGLQARLPALGVGPMRHLRDFGSRFLTAAQGYLHSDFCHRLNLECDTTGAIRITVDRNPGTAQAIDAALSHLVREMRKLGLVFIRRAASVIPYGGSKSAGSLPHAQQPSPANTDTLGRPFRAERIFVVDATVMPSIPGRNHTMTMLANALRIGQTA
jgi:hypothetical protein